MSAVTETPSESPRGSAQAILPGLACAARAQPPVRSPVGNGPRRNDPCPCGSGLKYKRCCLQANYQEEDPSLPAREAVIEALDQAISSGRGADAYLEWVWAREERHNALVATGGGAPTGVHDLALVEDARYLMELEERLASGQDLSAREDQHAALIRARWSQTDRGQRLLDHLLNPPDPNAPLDELGTLAVRERLLVALSEGRQPEALEALGFLRGRKAEHDPGEVEYFEGLYRLRSQEWAKALAAAARVPPDSPDYPKAWYVMLSASAHLGDVDAALRLLRETGGPGITLALMNLVNALLVMNGTPAPAQIIEMLSWVSKTRDVRFDPYGEEAARVLLPLAAGFIRQLRAAMTWAAAVGIDERSLPERFEDALGVLAEGDSRRSGLLRPWTALRAVMVDLSHSGLTVSRSGGAPEPMEGYMSLVELIWLDLRGGGTGIGPAGLCLFVPMEVGVPHVLQLEWFSLREEFGEDGLLITAFRERPEWFQMNPEYVPLLLSSLSASERADTELVASITERLGAVDDEPQWAPAIPAVVPPHAAMILSGASRTLRQLRADGQVWADAGPVVVGLFAALEATIRDAVLEPALRGAILEPVEPERWSRREQKWVPLYESLREIAGGHATTLALGQISVVLGKVTRPGEGRDAASRNAVRDLLARIMTAEGLEALDAGSLSTLIDMDRVGALRNAGAHGRLVSLDEALETERYVTDCLSALQRWVACPIA